METNLNIKGESNTSFASFKVFCFNEFQKNLWLKLHKNKYYDIFISFLVY
jgi:hypothetical protein